MSIAVLTQVYDEARRLAVAGSAVARGDFRLKKLLPPLEQAGASLADVVRVTYVLPRGDDFEACWPVLRKYFGDVRPAAMMIEARLLDAKMKIEIEVTAKKRG